MSLLLQRLDPQIDSEEHPIIIKNLHKVYPATDGNPPKTAVKSLSLAVKRGEVLGLIGPNGERRR